MGIRTNMYSPPQTSSPGGSGGGDWMSGTIAAAGTIAGSAITSASNAALQDKANKFNAEQAAIGRDFASDEASKNRKWQQMMSSTAYQRAMDDLRKAGLNPMLAYMQGGASTPGGGQAAASTATGQASRMEDFIGKGISAAMDYARYKKELKSVDSQVALNEAAGEAQRASAVLSSNSAKLAESNSEKARLETQALANSMPAIKAEAQNRETRAKIESSPAIQTFDAIMSRIPQFNFRGLLPQGRQQPGEIEVKKSPHKKYEGINLP